LEIVLQSVASIKITFVVKLIDLFVAPISEKSTKEHPDVKKD